MHIRTFAAAAALALAPMAASAVSVTVIDAARQGSNNDAGINFAKGYGAVTPFNATWDPLGEPTKLSNSVGVFQSPFNSNVLTATNQYFSVFDNGVAPGQSPKTLTFQRDVTSFTMLWGSIDTYNTLTFYDGVNGTGNSIVLGGAAAIAAALPTAGAVMGNDNPSTAVGSEIVALFEFMAAGANAGSLDAIRSIKFESSFAAFEFALPVPVPFGAALLVTAFGVAGVVSSRRRKAQAI